MNSTRLEIPDLILIDLKRIQDARGFLVESFHQHRLAEAGITGEFVQENHSASNRGVLRGLHYQIRQPQGKLLRLMQGEIFDVAVDLRRGSNTFGRACGVTLDGDKPQLLWVPPGFAHGFYVLSERAELLYRLTDYYAPEAERTLLWNDPALGIDWPLDDGRTPVLSERDLQGKLLAEAETFA